MAGPRTEIGARALLGPRRRLAVLAIRTALALEVPNGGPTWQVPRGTLARPTPVMGLVTASLAIRIGLRGPDGRTASTRRAIEAARTRTALAIATPTPEAISRTATFVVPRLANTLLA